MLFPIDISSAKAQKSLSYVNMTKHCYFMGCEPFVLQANRAKAKDISHTKMKLRKIVFLFPKRRRENQSSPGLEFGIICKNLALAEVSVANRPKTAIVAVLLPNFSIPREIIQV